MSKNEGGKTSREDFKFEGKLYSTCIYSDSTEDMIISNC